MRRWGAGGGADGAPVDMRKIIGRGEATKEKDNVEAQSAQSCSKREKSRSLASLGMTPGLHGGSVSDNATCQELGLLEKSKIFFRRVRQQLSVRRKLEGYDDVFAINHILREPLQSRL